MYRLRFASAILVLATIALAAQAAPRSCATNAVASASTMPGFCAFTWLAGLKFPRAIDILPNGDLLVVEIGLGRISANWEDGNGTVQSSTLFVNESLGLTHHVKYWSGFIYASSDTTVYRWAYPESQYRKDMGAYTVAVSNLPVGGHVARTMMFDSKDRIYINIGSGSNIDKNSDRARVVRSIAGVAAMPINYPDDFEVFADGTRNECGLRFDLRGRLWGVENGLDDLGVDPDTRKDFGDIHLTNPGEEVNLFLEENMHSHYGYPYCWSEGLGEGGKNLSFPEGLGNGTQWATTLADPVHTDAWCRNPQNVITPKWVMQAHSAPLDIYFYNGTTFPGMAGRVAFVAKHGSWDRPQDNQSGRAVSAIWLDEANGFPFAEETLLSGPNNWEHRPVGLMVGPCAAYGECLFVTDDFSGSILAIAAVASQSPAASVKPPSFQPDPLVVSLSLVGILAGLSLITGIIAYCCCWKRKATDYNALPN